MAERHAETVRQHDIKTDQASLDELAVTQKARNAARGIDAQNEERASTLRTGAGTAADREAVSRDSALAVHATRTAAVDLAPAAQAIVARRGDLAAAIRIADAAKQIPEDAEVENEGEIEESRSRA